LCPGATGQELGLGFERGQREREGWSARVPLLVGFARKERRKEERKKKGGHLAKIHLNFENSNYQERGSDGLLKRVL
jgi:hypothetical protein